MNPMRVRRLGMLIPFILVAGSGCSNFTLAPPFSAEEIVTKSFATKSVPQVMVDTFNGGIDVTTGNDNTVTVKVTKHGAGKSKEEAEDDLDNIEVTMTQEGNTIRVKAAMAPGQTASHRSAAVEVQVPAGSVLELRNDKGHIVATGPTGNVTAESTNGKIQVKESKGKLRLATTNGPIAVAGGSDRLELSTTNGHVEIESSHAVIEAGSTNGGIRFKGKLAPGNHSFHTTNGSIALTLPADASFRFDAETTWGSINNEFPAKGGGRDERSHKSGSVGDDSATEIKLETTNGSIAIRQGR